jgi:hypothetical protein
MSIFAIPDNTGRVWLAIIVAIAAVEAVILVKVWTEYQSLKKQVPYSFHEQSYVDRAVDAFARRERLPKEVVMQGRFPVVARTRDGLCVNIRGSAGGIGHVPIYCFDKNGGLVFHDSR